MKNDFRGSIADNHDFLFLPAQQLLIEREQVVSLHPTTHTTPWEESVRCNETSTNRFHRQKRLERE